MHRIFFFSGYRLKLFYWQRGKLQDTITFEPSDEGFAQFEEYLYETQTEPACFLVDLIEEDYVAKQLARCSGSSRRALVKRALKQQFRDLPYTCAIHQGPAKKTADADQEADEPAVKKDDYLLSALTNPSVMDPWLNRIREAGIPLSGIYSVAYYMRRIIKRFSLERPCVLLITQEVGTAFRQSYFYQGRLQFSRVAKLPRGSRDSEDGKAFADLLLSEINQMVQYLELQRRVRASDLEVHVLVPSAYLVSVEEALGHGTERSAKFVTHDVARVVPNKGLSHELADSLLAWFCARNALIEKHYSAAEDIQAYSAYQRTNRLVLASAATSVIAALVSVVFALQGERAIESAEALSKETSRLRVFYEEQYGAMQAELSVAEQVRDAVELADQVKALAQLTPQDFFIQLSQIVSQPQFNTVTLNGIEWEKGQGGEDQFDDLMALKLAQDPNYDPFLVDTSTTDGAGNEADVNIGVISGSFKITRESGYRRIVALANQFVDAIRAHERVERVDVLTLPVEHRSYKRFTDEVSQENSGSGGVSIDGSFKFRVIMRGPQNA